MRNKILQKNQEEKPNPLYKLDEQTRKNLAKYFFSASCLYFINIAMAIYAYDSFLDHDVIAGLFQLGLLLFLAIITVTMLVVAIIEF